MEKYNQLILMENYSWENQINERRKKQKKTYQALKLRKKKELAWFFLEKILKLKWVDI